MQRSDKTITDQADAETTRQPVARLVIDWQKCDRCLSHGMPLCTATCPRDAIYPCVNSNFIWAACDAVCDPAACRQCIEACPTGAIRVQHVPDVEVNRHAIWYFKSPGVQNTSLVVEAIVQRVSEGDIQSVVVASCSGSSALALARALHGKEMKIICISAPAAALGKWGWHPILPAMVARLTELGVICREERCTDQDKLNGFAAQPSFYDPLSHQESSIALLDRVFYETLVGVGGMGLKTAVECVFSACAGGEVAPGELVIGTAGTGLGLDTATVIRATTAEKCFARVPSERFEIREILAMPLQKQRWG